MKEQDSRTALRFSSQQKQQMQKLISDGKFKTLSQVMRAALDQFLKQNP